MLSKKKKNVYVVDDVLQNIQVICSNLKSKQIDISIANNGEQALEGIKNQTPDLILLDIAMPGIDGFEVCRRLKKDKNTASIPIIFLTARTQTDDIVKGFKLGAVDYITKPFSSEELRMRVFTQLEIAESRNIIEDKNRELTEKNSQLEQAVATKDRFFRIIAHDLKNPFTNLVGFSDILSSKFDVLDDDKKKYYISILKQVAQKGNKILNNLHEWSLSQTGELLIKPKAINLAEIIDENIAFHASGAVAKTINLHSKVKQNIQVFADDNMLNTIFRNVISNALKFTRKDGEVYVDACLKNNIVEISIVDNGLGIEEKNIEKILNIDGNYRSVGTNKETGTGLGLVLCKEFIRKNNGTLRIESEYEKGTAVVFTLPIVDDV